WPSSSSTAWSAPTTPPATPTRSPSEASRNRGWAARAGTKASRSTPRENPWSSTWPESRPTSRGGGEASLRVLLAEVSAGSHCADDDQPARQGWGGVSAVWRPRPAPAGGQLLRPDVAQILTVR